MKDIRPEQLPLARTEQLIVKEVDDEILVYDLASDQAHCLNDTAAQVWKNCDGEKSVPEISASLSKDNDRVNEEVVWLALEQLQKFKLLADAPTPPTLLAGMSRRQLMRNLGIAAVALPVVVSIIAPTPAHAVSCINPGQQAPGTSCTNHNQCCTDICSGTPKVCG